VIGPQELDGPRRRRKSGGEIRWYGSQNQPGSSCRSELKVKRLRQKRDGEVSVRYGAHGCAACPRASYPRMKSLVARRQTIEDNPDSSGPWSFSRIGFLRIDSIEATPALLRPAAIPRHLTFMVLFLTQDEVDRPLSRVGPLTHGMRHACVDLGRTNAADPLDTLERVVIWKPFDCETTLRTGRS
jgi:hypothetical protein